MCSQCDYPELISASGLEPTKNRVRVLGIIGNNDVPLTAAEVFHKASDNHRINRVTVYRILDLLVEHNLIEKLTTGGKAAYFGMAPNDNHAAHPHFYCIRCGQMDCLTPESIELQATGLHKNCPGKIGRIEVRVDGICTSCLDRQERLN